MRNFKMIPFSVALLSISLLSACGSDNGSSEAVASDQQSVSEQTEQSGSEQNFILIDVRTVEEFAEGHLEGALNLNVEDGTLEAALSDLDPTASYQVYCRSGRRSAIAVDLMTANGFTDIKDLGSVQQASDATGIPVVS